ncbi:MAG: hypothetical protein ACR2OE_14235, partial [Thermomicrobiales bacterium]
MPPTTTRSSRPARPERSERPSRPSRGPFDRQERPERRSRPNPIHGSTPTGSARPERAERPERAPREDGKRRGNHPAPKRPLASDRAVPDIEPITVTIDRIVGDGKGIGFLDGRTVFVGRTAPG